MKEEKEILKKVFLYATPLEKNLWVKNSRREGKKMSIWMREHLNQALDDDLKEVMKKSLVSSK